MLILIAGAGIWRLMQGPVELDRLVPYVQQAFTRSGTGLGIAVSGVSIGLDRETHQLDLRVQDVRVTRPTGEKLANFPQMATSLSVGALLDGRIEPTRITLEHPVLLLTRDATGALSFRFGRSETGVGDVGLDSAIGLFAPLREDGPWSRLRRVAIHDATILVDDRMTGRTWEANRVAATLTRSEEGVDGELSLAIVLGPNAPTLHATYSYGAVSQKLDLRLAVDGLDPTALAPLDAALAPLARLQMPVSGTLGLRLDVAAGKADGARVDLDFGEGRIETALFAGGSLAIAGGELHADYDPATAALRLDKLALNLGEGARLVVDGELGGLAPHLIAADSALPASLDGRVGVVLSHVPAARLDSLWPLGVAKGGKRWVTANIPEGVLDEVAMQLAVKLDPATLSAQFADARGTLRFHDLTVDYVKGLPPAQKVSGSATLADRRIDFTVAGGGVKSLKATGGTMTIVDLGAPVETMTIDLAITGPLQDALDVLDTKPFRYAHEIGLDPAHIGGKVDTQLHFKLPLLNDLKADVVDYAAKAALSGISVARIALDRNLSDGNFNLDLARTGVHVQGTGKFDGTPTTVDANLFFHPKTGPRARYRIGLTLDDEARRRLDLDFALGRLSGPVAVDLTYTAPPGGTKTQIDLALDLRAASLTVEEAGWRKPPQAPGSAKFTLELDNDSVVRVPEIEVKAAGLDGRFAMMPTADRKHVDRVEIRRLIIGDSDVTGVISRRQGGGWRAEIRGAKLDLSREIKRAVADDEPDAAPPLQIDARVARLSLGARREAQNVSAELLRDRGTWQSIRIEGRYADGHHLTLRLGEEAGNRRLHFESDDLGASLSLFGVADNVVGGHVKLDGNLFEVAGHHVLRAHVEGADYALVRAPALARLLSLASLEGLFSMMAGTGIPFTNLRGDFTYTEGRISLERLIGYGGALGVTAKGWFSPGQDRIDVDGTLAPAYALNSVVGNFPLIGTLLTGGEGQGLFAASFRLTGSNDDPTVAVNPLSALTPGMFRHLFDPFLGTAPTGPTQEAAH